jgi:proline iminopeptidase
MPDHRRYFDPDFYRVLLFDQRGSGRSTPLGLTEANHTWELVEDMESVRRALDVDRWILFGGSWGATLALIYAERHPERVIGMVLRGVFLARPRDLEWFFGPDGVARLFPESWRDFSRAMPLAERRNLVSAYYRCIHGSDQPSAVAAARSWSAWEDRVATWSLPPTSEKGAKPVDESRLLAKARIETHFAQGRYFIAENAILDHVGRLAGIPVSIVHGRRDLTCTLEAAWLLHRAIPRSIYAVVPEAGHLASEPAMVDALVRETDRMRDRLKS